jgi:5-methylcytosine-specific restriction enzyme A
MNTYLITWNPKLWPWVTLERDVAKLRKVGYLDDGWTCVTTQIRPGDRVFLLRQGEEPRGILGSGHATSERYEGQHFVDPDKRAHYVNVRFDVVLNPSKEAILETRNLIAAGLASVNWKTRGSGIRIAAESASKLESLWTAFLSGHGHSPVQNAEEVTTPERYFEGAVRQVMVNAYERDARARDACIRHYGPECTVCGLRFEDRYGELGKGFIHVHHVVPLARVGENYAIDPLKDLVPVCPNCHAMLHAGDTVLTIEELKIKMKPEPAPAFYVASRRK